MEEEATRGDILERVSRITSRSQVNTKGNAGDIKINTNSLNLKDGAFISTTTFGEGNAGSIEVSVRESMLLEGESSQGNRTFLGSRARENARGNGGKVEIETSSLAIEDGAIVSTSTFNTGNAGSVRIKANSVLLQGKSKIQARSRQCYR